MIQKNYAKKLASIGFSLIPCNEKKAPYETEWSKRDVKTPEEIENLNPTMWGCRTGYNDLECIDVDLKIFESLQDRKEWWEEYYIFLKDNIDEFDKKIVIAKTLNGGFHLIYKTTIKEGNQKLAKLKDYKEAIIETRGVGGQFILYGNFLTDLQYQDVKYITEEEREILFTISKSYNYIEPQNVILKKDKTYDGNNLKPWDDFNNQKNVLDIVGDEFKIVRQTTKSIIVKRHGAKSPHSGYIYKDSGCLYLFSTGTIYPHETLISPFMAYTIKNHNGNFSESAKDLYFKGYGERVQKITENITPVYKEDIKLNDTSFPIDIFNENIQVYINELHNKTNAITDFVGTALLYTASVCIGNSFLARACNTFIENASIWIANVASSGVGKTPSVKPVLNPLRKKNIKLVKDYNLKLEDFRRFDKLTKKEKENEIEVKEPLRNQILVNDITQEALMEIHGDNIGGLGVDKDELAGWIKDMDKYRAGSDVQFWLSAWNGEAVFSNRKTSKSAFVQMPFISVYGGIQPKVFRMFNNEELNDSGFLSRLLICYPETKVPYLNLEQIDEDLLLWYNENIIRFFDTIRRDIHINEDGEIKPLIINFSKEASAYFQEVYNSMSDIQNSEDINEYLKSMYPKQKNYIIRFSLILHVFNCFFDKKLSTEEIQKYTVEKAVKLSNYFIEQAKKVKVESNDLNDIKATTSKGKTPHEKFIEAYNSNKEVNKNLLAQELQVSRKTIYNWIKQLEKQ
jgi:hypothetical protein